MRKTAGAAAGLLLATMVLAPVAWADTSASQTWAHGAVAIDASIGVMYGEANEYVYRPDGSTLSQLVWAFDNDAVFNGGIAVSPLAWLTLGLRGRVNMSDASNMDDYDWYRPGEDDYDDCPNGFCHSRHPDTQLTSYLSVDAYVAATFFANPWLVLRALAGYKRESQSWKANDGPSNYAAFVPGRLSISYSQDWRAPYIGMQAGAQLRRWTLEARAIGSWWAHAQDEDNHHLRTLLFTESFGESSMVGANAQIGYRLTPNLTLTGAYDLQKWNLTKGPSADWNYTTGERSYRSWNAAGARSISQTFSFGALVEY